MAAELKETAGTPARGFDPISASLQPIDHPTALSHRRSVPGTEEDRTMAAKHIATYPLYGSNPITGRIWTNNRVGTGYINKPEQVEQERQRLAKYGHPLNLRWRNEECRARYYEWLESQEKATA